MEFIKLSAFGIGLFPVRTDACDVIGLIFILRVLRCKTTRKS